MTTLTIENADLLQKVSGSLNDSTVKVEKKKDTSQHIADYTQFFSKNPQYAVHSKEVKKLFRNNVVRFSSQDGNSVITVKKNSITATSKNGEPDIKAMLDLAEANGWQSIKLPKMLGRGSREFRNAIWQEATRRGIEVQGYQPTKLEQQALQASINKENQQPLKIVPTNQESKETTGLPESNATDKLLMTNSLTIEDAHKKIMSIYSEFVPADSPAYTEIEQIVERSLSDIYSAGKSVNAQQLSQVKETFAPKMSQARQGFHQAAAAEQQKTQTAERQHNKQSIQQQDKNERTL
ncbi:MAG: hypothetical protein IJ881_00280 [Neisseriaceae bacterium]|nr:hypothetical protein [Neisseriaceae bacterium]